MYQDKITRAENGALKARSTSFEVNRVNILEEIYFNNVLDLIEKSFDDLISVHNIPSGVLFECVMELSKEDYDFYRSAINASDLLSVFELGFSKRIRNILLSNGLFCSGQLKNMSTEDLLALPSIGITTAKMIASILDKNKKNSPFLVYATCAERECLIPIYPENHPSLFANSEAFCSDLN